jgi:outer membrane protein assembly factor BamC
MKSRNIILGLVAASLFAGCSIFDRKQVDYKAGAVQTPSLEVPPDLTVPESEQRYTIPGADGEKVASYSEYTKKKAEQPCVNPVSAPVAANPEQTTTPIPSAKLQENKGTKSILLGEPFDRSWRRVGLALDHARLVTSDKDRSKGIYFVVPAPDKDSKDSKKKQPDYQVVVRENSEGSEVTVVDQNGKSDAESARIIELVYQHLDKNDRGDERRPARGDAVRRPR